MPTFTENSHVDNRRPRSVLPASLLLAAVAFGLTLASESVSDAIRTTVRDGLRPGQHGFEAVVGTIKTGLRDWVGESEEQIADAESDDQEVELRRARIRIALLQEELARAKRIGTSPYRGRSPESPLSADLLQAQVLGEETAQLWRGGLMLNRGHGDGLAESDLVLKDDGTLIAAGNEQGLEPGFPVFAGRCVVGRVRTVGKWTSTVQRVTDADFRGHARLVRRTSTGYVFGAAGVLRGTGGDDCRLTLIPHSEPVEVGDEVYTLSDGGVFPAPLFYGKVTKVVPPSGTPHWEIHVQPAATQAKPRTVQILRKRLKPTRIASSEE